MLELLVCSLVTVVPDYLYRRYAQGKRIGHEITLYSVWFELRWGIVSCLMLTVMLITLVFYYHPSTTNAAAYFRTVPIVPEISGRVAQVMVDPSDQVKADEPLFRLDDQQQRAAVATLERRIAEIDAQMMVTKAEIAASEGQARAAGGAHQRALDEYETKAELFKRNPNVVPERQVEDLKNQVAATQGSLDAALAASEQAKERLATLLPAQKASAEAALHEARVQLQKTTVRAGVAGRVEQFSLKPGDFVTAIGRPAGVLIPLQAGRDLLMAGFGQIEAQVIKVGMVAEAACPALPLAIVPMVVTEVQDYIASGQFGTGQQLLDPANFSKAGSILVRLKPLFEGGLDLLPPGANCMVNLYSDHHEELASGKVGGLKAVFLHVVDTVGLVHAALLRIQTLLFPIQTLVLGGH